MNSLKRVERVDELKVRNYEEKKLETPVN